MKQAEKSCHQDPVELCRWLVDKSVLPWYVWALQAHVRYEELGCPAPKKVAPKVPQLGGCGDSEDCRDVCKRFRAWAKDFRKWADDFNKASKKCIKWSAKIYVPKVPTGKCQTCDDVCAHLRDFHTALDKWGEEIRTELNNAPGGGPGFVPPPPPPP